MNFKTIPFHTEHLNLMDLRPQEQSELDADPNAISRIYHLAEFGQGWTLISEGRILCAAGWYQLRPGVFEIWSFPTKWIEERRYGILYLKQLRRFRTILENEFQPHRIQSASIADDLHNRFMEYCGFTCEGELPMYSTTKVNYRMWGRTYGT